MKNTKYFVVSLPRTGTVSLSRMAKICGLLPFHAPLWNLKREFGGTNFNFFSDTPVFCPSSVEMICSNSTIESKFIFIDRPYNEIFDSWKRLNLFNNYNNLINTDNNKLSTSQKFDLASYTEAFGGEVLTEANYFQIFDKHKTNILKLIRDYNKPVLLYKFQYGWDPFCDFIEASVPTEELPHLNKTTMFDKI